jgi:hypothetical protein
MKITPEMMAACVTCNDGTYYMFAPSATARPRRYWLCAACAFCGEPYFSTRFYKHGVLVTSKHCSEECSQHKKPKILSAEEKAVAEQKKEATRIKQGKIRAKPNSGAARHRVFRYCSGKAQERGIDFELTEEDVLALVVQPCVYCNVETSRLIGSRSEHTPEASFACNGIDRIDSSKGYSAGNVVPCCSDCNHGKQKLSVSEFILWARRVTEFNPSQTEVLTQAPGAPFTDTALVKMTIGVNYLYNKSEARKSIKFELTYEQAESLMRSQCSYCGALPYAKKVYFDNTDRFILYTGIDRIDSTVSYTVDNVVPCCKHCNYAKNTLSVSDFYAWVNRIVAFQDSLANTKVA